MYYAVDSITERRIRPEDGVVEYLTHWQGHSAEQATWEPRSYVTENCAEAVQVVDQEEMEATDARIAQWRAAHTDCQTGGTAGRKRARAAADNGTASEEEIEILSSVLLRGTGARGAAKAAEAPTTLEPASVVMLGEVVLTEEAAAFLGNPTKRARRGASGQGESNIPQLCASAVGLEKSWRERHGVSLMHSCVGCSSHCELASTFAFEATKDDVDAERHMYEGRLEILGLVPVETSSSGLPFQKPLTFVPWVGDEEAERLRRESVTDYPVLGPAAQDLLRPQREQMLVRYALTQPSTEEGGKEEGEALARPRRVVASMPLTVFRVVFPQLLLDYLLENAVVLEGP